MLEMKFSGTWMLAAWLGLAPSPVGAQLQLVTNAEPQCVFAGAAKNIAVIFRNPDNQNFAADVRAGIFQTSSATAVQIGDVAWKKLQVLPQQTVLESAQLDFPAVRSATKFLVRWFENTNRVIGVSTVWVYPTNLLAELNPLLAGQVLGVLDPNASLKPLLKQNGVKFTDLGESALEDFRGRLAILGPFSSKLQLSEAMLKRFKSLAANGESVLWLQPPAGFRDKLQPSYFSVISGTNAIVVVQSSLVNNLAENPQSQETLLELCRQALQPAAPALIYPASQP